MAKISYDIRESGKLLIMIKKIFFLLIGFYILALLESSFFVHFQIFGITMSFIPILVILINLFEKTKNYLGLGSALVGGFFLDIFSENFFGFWILILLVFSVFIKFVLKKHVHLPIFK